jgi:hypothetical protein
MVIINYGVFQSSRIFVKPLNLLPKIYGQFIFCLLSVYCLQLLCKLFPRYFPEFSKFPKLRAIAVPCKKSYT